MLGAVVVAGFAGAVARYLLDGLVQDRVEGVFPLGTFVVNLSGSLLLGFVAGLVIYQGAPAGLQTVAGTGFLGSYTTFSTFAFETARLAEDGADLEALLNALGSVVCGLAAAVAGLALAAAV